MCVQAQLLLLAPVTVLKFSRYLIWKTMVLPSDGTFCFLQWQISVSLSDYFSGNKILYAESYAPST